MKPLEFCVSYYLLDERVTSPKAYLEKPYKPYWAEIDVNWKYVQVIEKSAYDELEAKLKAAETELKRMLDANYTSLLAATAFMGIPDRKREEFINSHLDNSKFICEEALKKIRGAE